MLECLPASESPHIHSSPIQAPGTPVDASPGSSTSTINLSRAYTATVLQANSFKEMFRIVSALDLLLFAEQDHQMLSQVLCPDRDHVLNALQRSKPNSLSNLISSYFDYSEKTARFCLTLRRSVAAARRLYCPILTLFHDLPIDDPLSRSHCLRVFQEFQKFDEEPNPFTLPDSKTFDAIREPFCDLKRQLERRLRKSSSKIRLVRPPSAADAESNTICCSAAGFTAYIPPKFVRRELAYAAQLKVASMNTYVLKTDLDTLDSLVSRLYNIVEDDKRFIRLVGNDEHTVQEVLKELEKNHQHLEQYLDLLVQKICTCFTTVNRSRSQLLQEILPHQPSSQFSHSQQSHFN